MARVSRSRCSSEVRLSTGAAGAGCSAAAAEDTGGGGLGGVSADLGGAGRLTWTAVSVALLALVATGPEAGIGGAGGTSAAAGVGGATGFIGGTAGCAGTVAVGAAAGATGGKWLHAASTTGSRKTAIISLFTLDHVKEIKLVAHQILAVHFDCITSFGLGALYQGALVSARSAHFEERQAGEAGPFRNTVALRRSGRSCNTCGQ